VQAEELSMRFLAMRNVAAVAAAMLLGTALGCGEKGFTTITPTPATKTDSFSGSFAQGGSSVHSFNVAAAGTVTITVTSVGPLSTMGLGVGVGNWDGTNCGASAAVNTNARAGTTGLEGTYLAGNYCVRLYDSGNIPSGWTVTYSVDVLHP
jgi:hypothetical protein